MKHLLICAAILTSILSADEAGAAKVNAGQIYQTLDTAAKKTTPDGMLGAVTHEKSLGGLTCTETKVVHPNAKPKYRCTLAKDHDASQIYARLKMEEKDTTEGKLGASTHEKSVGGLVCRKTKVVAPKAKPKFSCSLATDAHKTVSDGADAGNENSAE